MLTLSGTKVIDYVIVWTSDRTGETNFRA